MCMFITYVINIGPCRVSNCLRCQFLNSSCCMECGSGYELVNGCQCGEISIKY